MIKKLYFCIFFIFLSQVLLITIENYNYLRIISGFCELRNNDFHNGIDIISDGNNIISLMDEEIIFYSNNRKNSLNYTYGNFIILEDRTNKYRFNYSHLDNYTFDVSKNLYSKGEVIASYTEELISEKDNYYHFDIEDIEKKVYINPLAFLKEEDKSNPRILNVYFILDNNEKISLTDSYKYVIERGGKIFIKCYDLFHNKNISPYKITLYADGEEKANIDFEILNKTEKKFTTKTGKMSSDIYLNNENFDYFIYDFYTLPGVVGLKIIVEDFSGNKVIFLRNLVIKYPALDKNNEK